MNSKLIISFIAVGILIFGFWLFFSGSENSEPRLSEAAKSSSAGAAAFENISPAELSKMLNQAEKDFTLINVHIPYAGEIEGTDKFIPFDKIQNNLDQLPDDKTAKVVLYCRSGGMSAVAAQKLTELGYANVKNLSGGMIEWEKEGYPLKREIQ